MVAKSAQAGVTSLTGELRAESCGFGGGGVPHPRSGDSMGGRGKRSAIHSRGATWGLREHRADGGRRVGQPPPTARGSGPPRRRPHRAAHPPTRTIRGQDPRGMGGGRSAPRVDSGAEGRTRTGMACATRPSNVRVYQFRHFGTLNHRRHHSKLVSGCCRYSEIARCADSGPPSSRRHHIPRPAKRMARDDLSFAPARRKVTSAAPVPACRVPLAPGCSELPQPACSARRAPPPPVRPGPGRSPPASLSPRR